MADNQTGYQYPLDTTGQKSSNKVTGERQTLNPSGMMDYFVLIPKAAPYFKNSLVVKRYPGGEVLLPGVHYGYSHLFSSALEEIGVGVYGSITFYDHTLQGSVELDYQTLGGSWTLSEQEIANILANILTDPRLTTWEEVTGMPTVFPPIDHEHNIDDMYGADDIVRVLEEIRDILEQTSDTELRNHLADFNNPHQVTKVQVGLGNVDNFATANAEDATGTRNDRFMTPQTTRLAMTSYVIPLLDQHREDYGNPHQVTKSQVRLGNVENYGITTRAEAEAGVANNKYMTPLMTSFAISAQVGDAFDAHLADFNNPHQVTKVQVGLGNVNDWPVATNEEIDLGTTPNRYVDLVGVIRAINTRAGGELGNHLNDLNNPHQVTKGQVGLGNVQNYAVADVEAAKAGTAQDLYMTPQTTREAITAQVGLALIAHTNDTDNPHHVTKNQVGLSAVENYGVASAEEAREGEAGDKYMTPQRVAQAVEAQVGDTLTAHLVNTNNPHGVTKTQVNLGNVENYGLADATTAKAGVSNEAYITPYTLKEGVSVMKAGDTGRLFGMDQPATIAWIGGLTAGDADKVYGLDLSELTQQVLSGTAANSLKLEGRGWNDIVQLVDSQAGGAAQNNIPPIVEVEVYDDDTQTTSPQAMDESWTHFATLPRELPAGTVWANDLVFILSGGAPESADVTPVQRVIMTIGTSETATAGTWQMDNVAFSIESLNGLTGPEVGVTDSSDSFGKPQYDLWLKDGKLRSGVGLVMVSDNTLDMVEVPLITVDDDLVVTEPTGIVYATRIASVDDLQYTLEQGFNSFAAEVQALG
ncbi:hypothetical protein ACLPJK_25845 [Pseudomonas aeruginosa]|uniref:hypothetical protein n=1 Tax=Pseudomonas aeruginosa TaxID=287 RepID=UPI003D285ECB